LARHCLDLQSLRALELNKLAAALVPAVAVHFSVKPHLLFPSKCCGQSVLLAAVAGVLGVEELHAKPCKVAEDARAICRTIWVPMA
jgi:hypothetical protein